MATKLNDARLLNLAQRLYNAMGQESKSQFDSSVIGALNPSGVDGVVPTGFQNLTKAQGGITPGQLGQLGVGAAINHPFKTMALAGSAAGNIGGLTDNDKFGGQLAGLGLGGLGAYALAQGNPYLAAMMTMGGGNIGALFDKLRARKEMEQAQGIPNAGNPIAMLGRR